MDLEKVPAEGAQQEPGSNTLNSALQNMLQPDSSCEEVNVLTPTLEDLSYPQPRSEFPDRWASEARFFDAEAEKLLRKLQPLDLRTVARYHDPEHSWFNKEFRFQLLGNLRGKRVLDMGCGDGVNSVLMAKYGAQVTGVDISPGSIELCKQRAQVDEVESQTRFICSPLETVNLPEESFDVIWGDGVLHHLIPELDTVMHQLMRWAKPGALFVFSEPVSLTPWLRKLRKGVPIHTHATPDERPLEKAELSILLRHLPNLEMKWFHLLGRLNRFIVPDYYTYERATLARRLLLDGLGRLDEMVLSVPYLQTLGGMCVMYGWKAGPR
jgi:2-polyprenyl-3-methyl-5-hydroxy-6-metoxy-1,4-benzoquinol methylase